MHVASVLVNKLKVGVVILRRESLSVLFSLRWKPCPHPVGTFLMPAGPLGSFTLAPVGQGTMSVIYGDQEIKSLRVCVIHGIQAFTKKHGTLCGKERACQ